MNMGKIIRVLTVGAATACLVMSLQGSAAAANYVKTAVEGSPDWSKLGACAYVYYNGEAGRACFQRDGDKFWVEDLLSDGHHVEMNAQVNVTGNWYHCADYGGNEAGWTYCTFATEMPENARIIYNSSVWEGHDLLANSGPFGSDT